MSSVTTLQSTTLGELLLEPIATSASLNEELNRTQTGVSWVLYTSDSGSGLKYQNDQNMWKPQQHLLS